MLELFDKLKVFCESETDTFYKELATKRVENFKASANSEELSRLWSDSLRINRFDAATYSSQTEMEKFATVYHKLIHSAALETLFALEQKYAADVSALIAQKDEDVRAIQERSKVA